MTRLPTPAEKDTTASFAIRDESALLDVARHLPGCLFELTHDPVSGYRVGYVGDGVRALLGLEPQTVAADPGQVLAMAARDDRMRLSEAMARCARERACWHDEVRLRTVDGREVWLSIEARPTPGDGGEIRWHGWCHATTERHAAWAALVDSEQRHRRLFDANPMPMWVHDRLTLRFLTVNEAATVRYGWSRDEFLRMTLVDLRYPGPDPAPESGAASLASEPSETASAEPLQAAADDGVEPATAHHRLKDGQLIEVELTSQPITWNGRPARMVMAIDVTDRRRAEAEIQRLAYYDTLTGLPNRRLLADRMRQSIAAAVRSGRYGAVLCLDLDDFKRVNDTRGHPVGDQVLIEAGARLKTCVRTEDIVARIGGDEFVIVLEHLGDDARQAAANADETAYRVITALSRPFELPGLRFHSSASIGVAMFGGVASGVDDALMHADSAMYRAKAAGRGTIRFYDPAMQVALQTRAALETDLRRALSEGQLRLAYQSQVDTTGRILGAEVLLRWQHPERGSVPPMDFIPLAEETGLIVPIGQWVLETACTQLAGWARKSPTRELRLSVNVSARQFRQPDFVHRVERALSDSGTDPARLRLELTESLLLDNINDCIAKMQSLKSIGVGFALDDFGTGYSSLSYLKRLPLDELKIDRSFIRDIATDPSDAVIVQTIIGMAKNLGLEVIAEGVETTDQVAFLSRNGCTAYQGWLFGRAVPLPEFEASLDAPPTPPVPAAAAVPSRGGAAARGR